MNLYIIKSPKGDGTGDQFRPRFFGSLKWKQKLIYNCPFPSFPSTITACLFVSPGVGRACRLPELNGTRGVEMCESASAVKVLTDIGVTQWWWGCWCSTSRFPGHTAGKQKQGRAVWSTTSRLFWLQCTLRIALKAPVPKHNSHQDAKLGQSVRGKIAQSSRSVSCQMSSEAMVYTLYIYKKFCVVCLKIKKRQTFYYLTCIHQDWFIIIRFIQNQVSLSLKLGSIQIDLI